MLEGTRHLGIGSTGPARPLSKDVGAHSALGIFRRLLTARDSSVLDAAGEAILQVSNGQRGGREIVAWCILKAQAAAHNNAKY